ncbi:MAG: hypothetical protein HYZ42_06710, partial [Bacteroidetes bacterium]|nr:hypothetical protein [Bacteroidota bacterium]
MKQFYILLISIFFCSQAMAQKLASQTNLLDLDAEGFYPNKRQIKDINEIYNEEVTYINYGREMNIQLRKNGFSYERFVCYGRKDTTHQPFEKFLPQRSKILDEKVIYDRIDIDLEGMNTDVKIEAQEMSSDYMHYNLEEQGIEKKVNVNRYRKVIYKNVYTGIDLEFVMNNGQFKFNWILQPGADLNQIKLTYHNAQKLTITKENTLLIKTHLGVLEESLPASYWVSAQPQTNDE